MRPSQTPVGWVITNLDSLVAKMRNGTTAKQNQDGVGVPVSRIETISDSKIDLERVRHVENPDERVLTQFLLRNGDILFSHINTGLHLGKSVVFKLRSQLLHGMNLMLFRPVHDLVLPEFLNYQINYKRFRGELLEVAQHAVNQASLNQTILKKLQFSLPPLPEQERIVEKIETLFAELDKGEEALREVQKLLARYRQSVLKAAVTGELTADWRKAHGKPTESGQDQLARILKQRRETWQGRGSYQKPIVPDTSELTKLPIGWAWASMDQLLSHLTSGSRDWKQYYGRGTGTFIMAQNVRPMRFDITERFLVDPPKQGPDALRSEVNREDLLITIVGANTGDICRFPTDEREHYVCQSVALIRLVDIELAAFTELYLSGKGAGRDQLDKHIYGAGRPHLSFEQLRSIAVPLPPADERDEMMQQVETIFANLAMVQRACEDELLRSRAMRQSILKDAFSGKLVPQDPSDEPAEKLLERIRAAREEKPNAKRQKAMT